MPHKTFAAALTLFVLMLHVALAAERTETHLLYVTMPGTYYGEGAPGMLVFDIDQGHKFVRRIATPNFGQQTKGFCASLPTKKLYVSSTKALWCFDLTTDKVLWEKTYEKGCDRMAITPDGKTIYMPSLEGRDWQVLEAATGEPMTRIETKEGPHNTLTSLDGAFAYLASLKYPKLTVVDTRNNKVLKEVGPFSSAIRPFTVNGRGTLCFVNVDGLCGFEIGDLVTGQKLYRVEVPGGKGAGGRHGCPSHGVGLTPDEKEVWVADSSGKAMQIFDATVMPPKYLARVELKNEPGWITFSIDGRYAYPSTGDVIDTKTREIVTTLRDEAAKPVMSEKLLEIDFANGAPVRVGNQFGVGRVTQARAATH
jgi:DNA-binding beta-propeller fold protein YncE